MNKRKSNSADALRKRLSRISENSEQRFARIEKQKIRIREIRQQESEEQLQKRLDEQRIRQFNLRIRKRKTSQWFESAFNYDPTYNYSSEPNVIIGNMSTICVHCGARKWNKETQGMCCSNGKVHLTNLQDPPSYLRELLSNNTLDSKHFLKNIQKYNSAFTMTSFGANIIAETRFMPTFKIQGQIYHRIGSLFPQTGEDPQYLQLYFVGDLQEQAQSRCNITQGIKHNIILALQEILHACNSYIHSLKYALEQPFTPECRIIIDADKRPTGEHARRFNAPENNEIAVILHNEQHGKRDIVIKYKDNSLMRINETHRSYDALQYPLLFINGEDGYHFAIAQTGDDTRKTVSCMDFYSYRFMIRDNSFNHLHRSQNLFSQFCVDMYAKVESERLCYIATHQKELRSESYIHLQDAINNDVAVGNIGQLCILPSSFTGSPRYMHERTQDAMTYVRNYGRPDLFITFTCNPKWKEIQEELLSNQSHIYRHDLIARVFHLKLIKLMDLIVKSQIFGQVRCHMYTVEWQKRGLPHAHILIWLIRKIHSDQIDKFISAEFPDPSKDSELFNIIKAQMVHGPCGILNFKSPCMNNNKCAKRYPKQFLKETQLAEDGYPSYRRRSPKDGGFSARIGRHEVDNRWIVPYCPLLSKTFNAHINVEFCNSVKSIKYVCKYINKGSDAAMFGIHQENKLNEVIQYQLGRYISSNEAFWRIFGFSIHERYPAIQQLAVHLENGQRVYFTTETAALQSMAPKDTTLTAFFKLCTYDSFAKTLLYYQVPSYYTWKKNQWHRRKRGSPVEGFTDIKFDATIGRVYTIHPNQHECFFLRMLLHEVIGPTSFEDLRTVDSSICLTYREACLKRGMLEDDAQWVKTMEEATLSRSANGLRCLFAILITICDVANPKDLWMKFRDDLSEDLKNSEISFNEEIYNLALIRIEDRVESINGAKLNTLGLPKTIRNEPELPRELIRETSYDIEILNQYVNNNEAKLLAEQRLAYMNILDAIQTKKGGIFFLDAPGGTGKTFVTNLLLAKIRQKKKIALAIASSGIAATLLPGGRTVHSAFKLPLNLATNESPVCSISKNSGTARALNECQLIVWDECAMSHKGALEAINRSLQDILGTTLLMGGITLVLSGDFRQILPVIPNGTKADGIRACLKSSFIWPHVKTYKFTTNMRAYISGHNNFEKFSTSLIALGEGKTYIGGSNNIYPGQIGSIVDTEKDLITSVFPDIIQNYNKHDWLCERSILAPKNIVVNTINNQLLNTIPGECYTYKSMDTVTDINECVNYPTEFLNSLDPPGFPPHVLKLKINSPIILLRNLIQPKLCNGTRLIVQKLMPNVIEAVIITGCGKGESVFIPRISLIPADMPFSFKRLQFPVRLSFAMSINKSQGQTLAVVGLHLEEDCFSHGQLYVGCSRVGNPDKLFIYSPSGVTRNIVYKEVLT